MDGVIMIRQETEEDFRQVQEVVRLAFQGVEESDHTEHLLVERLRRSDAYIPQLSLVAETDGKIAGHVLLSEVKVVAGSDVHTVLSVAPLSVLTAYHRKGRGGMLRREAHKGA